MRYFILFFVLLFLNGCTSVSQSEFIVSIDSLTSHLSEAQKTYLLRPSNDGAPANDLQFKEYSRYVTYALNMQGYRLAKSAQEATIEIVLTYGIKGPKTRQYSYSIPMWGYRNVYPRHRRGNYRSSYYKRGYIENTLIKTTFIRYIVMTAYSVNTQKNAIKKEQLWKTSIKSVGESDDLRFIFPILMAASLPYLAMDTGHKISVLILDSDVTVKKMQALKTATVKK